MKTLKIQHMTWILFAVMIAGYLVYSSQYPFPREGFTFFDRLGEIHVLMFTVLIATTFSLKAFFSVEKNTISLWSPVIATGTLVCIYGMSLILKTAVHDEDLFKIIFIVAVLFFVGVLFVSRSLIVSYVDSAENIKDLLKSSSYRKYYRSLYNKMSDFIGRGFTVENLLEFYSRDPEYILPLYHSNMARHSINIYIKRNDTSGICYVPNHTTKLLDHLYIGLTNASSSHLDLIDDVMETIAYNNKEGFVAAIRPLILKEQSEETVNKLTHIFNVLYAHTSKTTYSALTRYAEACYKRISTEGKNMNMRIRDADLDDLMEELEYAIQGKKDEWFLQDFVACYREQSARVFTKKGFESWKADLVMFNKLLAMSKDERNSDLIIHGVTHLVTIASKSDDAFLELANAKDLNLDKRIKEIFKTVAKAIET